MTATGDTEPDPPEETILDLIQGRFESFSPAERQVARAVIADYPTACLGSVASLASTADVSAPSVVRFAKAIGYDSYIQLRDNVMAEIASHSKGPLDRAQRFDQDRHLPHIKQKLEILLSDASHSLASIPEAEWNTVADLLADNTKTIYITGGRFSTAVATILALNLQLLRANVILLDDLAQGDMGRLLDMNHRSVFFVFDFYRYQRSVIRAAQTARQHGATIILMTDGEGSPIKTDATHVLPVATTSFLPLNGLSTAVTVVELLLGDIYKRLGDNARKHLTEWELLTGDEKIQ